MLPVNQAAIDSALQVYCSYFFPLYMFCIFLNVLKTLDVQPAIGPDGKRKEHKSNVLLATIENMQYAVPLDVLHSVRILFLIKRVIYWWFIFNTSDMHLQVFSAFGFVQKVAMFDKHGHTHALIQYPGIDPIWLKLLIATLELTLLIKWNSYLSIYCSCASVAQQ